ncbi:trehalose-phosphatase [Sinirhodobacter huangdaonensis]
MTFSMMISQSAPPALAPAHASLFLDFDGTLVGIAPRPDAVVVPPGLAAHLRRLSDAFDGALAIVSGRSLPELARFLDGFEGLLVGSHGAEARGMTPPLAHAPAGIGAVQAALSAFAAREGLLYEPKTLGGAVHFRDRPAAGAAVAAFADALAAASPGFAVQPAKMAFELKPEGASKDRALAALAALPAFAGRAPVFLGDDATDEPALAWAGAQGGFGVKVGPGDSTARYRLPDPGAVLRWLGMEG